MLYQRFLVVIIRRYLFFVPRFTRWFIRSLLGVPTISFYHIEEHNQEYISERKTWHSIQLLKIHHINTPNNRPMKRRLEQCIIADKKRIQRQITLYTKEEPLHVITHNGSKENNMKN